MSSAQFFILLSVIYSSSAITPGWALVLGGVCFVLARVAFWYERERR